MSLLSEVVAPEAWFRAVSLKILREIKPGFISLKLPFHTFEHLLEALEASGRLSWSSLLFSNQVILVSKYGLFAIVA